MFTFMKKWFITNKCTLMSDNTNFVKVVANKEIITNIKTSSSDQYIQEI